MEESGRNRPETVANRLGSKWPKQAETLAAG
jgi:hypothetical protein